MFPRDGGRSLDSMGYIIKSAKELGSGIMLPIRTLSLVLESISYAVGVLFDKDLPRP